MAFLITKAELLKQTPTFKSAASSPPAVPFSGSWLEIFLVCLLLWIPFFIFQKTFRFDFINWDDPLHVYANPFIRSFSPEAVAAWFTKPFVSLYIPLPMASYALDYLWGGAAAAVYHKTNVIFHLLNTLLVFFLFRRIFKDPLAAFFGALLFSVHPVQVETVAWISERKTLVCAFFSLLAANWFLGTPKNRVLYWTVLFFLFACALLSKVSAVMLPFVLFAYRQLAGGPEAGKKSWLALFLVPAFFAVFLTVPLYSKFSIFYEGRWAAELFFYPALRAGLYLKNALWPNALVLFYPLHAFEKGALPYILLSVSALAFTLSGVFRKKSFSFWLLWLWLWLLPVLTLFGVSVADHHFYLPLIGLIGTLMCLKSFVRTGIYFILAALSLACLPLTSKQLLVWETSGALFENVLARYPSDYRASIHLADFYQSRGRIPEAVALNERLVHGWNQIPEAYLNLANLYLSTGNPDKAVETAAFMEKNLPGHAHVELIRGLAAQAAGQPEKAVESLKKAYAAAPSDRLVLMSLGKVYAQQKLPREAVPFFQKTAETFGDAEAYYYLGLVQNSLQNWEVALSYFRLMHKMRLYYPGTYFQEGYANLKLGRREEAKAAYLKSTRTDPGHAEAFYHLGLMNYETRNFADALEFFQKALLLKPDAANVREMISKTLREAHAA